jgi:hypothetical protein
MIGQAGAEVQCRREGLLFLKKKKQKDFYPFTAVGFCLNE